MKQLLESVTLSRAALLLGIASVLAGCGGRGGAAKGASVGLVLANGSSVADREIRRGAEGFAKKNGMRLVVEDAKDSADAQARAVDRLLERKVQALIVAPVNPDKLKTHVRKCARAKIPVVAVGTGIGGAVSTVESNEQHAGYLLADYLGHRLKQGGKVAVLGPVETASERQRLAAFRSRLGELRPPVRAVGHAQVEGPAAQRAAAKLLAQHPDLGAIVALDDGAGLGAVRAVRARRGRARCFVVSYGGAPRAVKELKKADSPLALVVGTFPRRIGWVATRQARELIVAKRTEPKRRVPVLPVVRGNDSGYRGMRGAPPKVMRVPWPSKLILQRAKQS